jgi:hypothetical protein
MTFWFRHLNLASMKAAGFAPAAFDSRAQIKTINLMALFSLQPFVRGTSVNAAGLLGWLQYTPEYQRECCVSNKFE